MTQEQIEKINNRITEVYGKGFLITNPLATIIAKAYDLGCSDTNESRQKED